MKSGSRRLVVFVLSVISVECFACADEKNQERPTADRVQTKRFVYKNKPRRALTVYLPDGWKSTDSRSAMVIFRCRIPVQREHFRKLGMVVIKPNLAPVNSGKLPSMSLKEIAAAPKPRHQVEDCKSAIRFIRAHAGQLGVDPKRIVATGTSGGGDLALQAYLNTSFADSSDDASVSPRPNALVLYCPAFDGIDIWYVKTATLVKRVKANSPAFLPLLPRFIKNSGDVYAVPLDHRANLIQLASKLGKEKSIADAQIESFHETLKLFNARDWQLLHPPEDALKMSASRILTRKPLPPTLLLLGGRDHLAKPQKAFVSKARSLGHRFRLKIYPSGGHSFMMQPAFLQPSTREVELFLGDIGFTK